MRKLMLFGLVLGGLLFQSLSGQNTDYYFFDQGVEFYRQKNFSAARANFLKITSEFPDSPIMTASLLMLMRSQYQLKEYQMAEATGNLLIKKFPQSTYKDDAYFWLGCIKLINDQNQHAVLYWLLSFKHSENEKLKKILSDYLREAMTNLLTESELNKLANKLDDPDLKIIARISYAKILISERQYKKASALLKNVIQAYPDNIHIQWVKKILNDIPADIISSKKLLVSVPTSGEYSEMGEAFKRGMLYAKQETNNGNSVTNDPVIFVNDSNSTVTAITQIKSTIEAEDIWAIIGSLTNDITATLALISYYNQIPVISPTASDKNIHDITPNFYQINPDPFNKGVALAEFAKNNFPHKNIVIMTPSDIYGDEFNRGFISIWSDSDSVRYISNEKFDPNTNSFLNQLKKIRKTALISIFADSIKQENPEITEEELLSMYKVWLDEKMEKLEEIHGGRVDTLNIPVDNIDLFIAAIYKDQIEPFARQYKFYNFQSQLMGNEGWYEPESLEKIKNYVNGLIFLTPLYLDLENNNFRNFRNTFRMAMQTTPDQMHVLGYNLGKWIYPLILKSDSKKEFIQNLQDNDQFKGIGQDINYSNGNRINQYLNIIQFKYGHYFKIN